MQHVFIVGAKGLGNYGGYETFVDKLTEYQQDDKEIQYHIACKGTEDKVFTYHNARCFQVKVPDVGSAQAIYYDITALKRCIAYIRKHRIKHPIVYILACRIGPFMGSITRQIHKLGGVVYVNPDGHEWKRAKWSLPVRRYWKHSERMMVKSCDLLVCDSKNIEKYIRSEYKNYKPQTTFIAYGSETASSTLLDDDAKYVKWLDTNGLAAHEYYLVVGRLVPENNFETMIREFIASNSRKNLAIISTPNEPLLAQLEEKLHWKSDSRVKFVGTVYDQELLKKIRENAYGYLHGHEVGGTNPSLLEALGSTDVNLLLGVGFNREVGVDAALYWNKEEGNLAALIDRADQMADDEIAQYGMKAKQRIADAYSWEFISNQYKNLFLKGPDTVVRK